ncbi:MAG: AAA family ATPase [Isosphaerales bacterium]
MQTSASMVRALAGLDVYLKLFCDRGGLLVIDEPEMNAHPEAQLKIIEFLALMAHHGVVVVLTTHSPYIVDHLSNLMQASQLGERAKQAIAPKFKLGMHEAFLSPDEVSVYLFNESGVVENILDREQGIIDLTSFSGPTEYVANLVNAIWKRSGPRRLRDRGTGRCRLITCISGQPRGVVRARSGS